MKYAYIHLLTRCTVSGKKQGSC